MAKTVVNKYGSLVIGGCPKCPEKISVYLRKGEDYKNGRCVYCGADIHGDGISGLIRDGHLPDWMTENGKAAKKPGGRSFAPATHSGYGNGSKNTMHEIAEYDEYLQNAGGKRHALLRRLPRFLTKKAKKPAGG